MTFLGYLLKNAFSEVLHMLRRGEFRLLLNELYRGLLVLLFLPFPRNGVKVQDEDWDVLIVLDACRYDTFSDLSDIDGDLSKERGLTCTEEWIRYNFQGPQDDTVVVGGNPHYSDFMLDRMLGGNPFHHVEPVWDYGWDDELGTSVPSRVTEAALKAHDQHPDKRLIVHYNQPHHPFIGETRVEGAGDTKEFKEGAVTVWDRLKAGNADVDDVREAYRDNLKLVLTEVETLLEHLPGKIVVTADHGNLFGEYGLHGHPRVPVKSLTAVPWLEIDNKTTTEDIDI